LHLGPEFVGERVVTCLCRRLDDASKKRDDPIFAISGDESEALARRSQRVAESRARLPQFPHDLVAIEGAIGATGGLEGGRRSTEPSLDLRFGSARVFAQGATLKYRAVVREAGLVDPILERVEPFGQTLPERECGACVAGRFVVDRRAHHQSALLEDTRGRTRRCSVVGPADGHGPRSIGRWEALVRVARPRALSAIPRQSDRFAGPALAPQHLLQPVSRPGVVHFVRGGVEQGTAE
jgi:hypothetical protein